MQDENRKTDLENTNEQEPENKGVAKKVSVAVIVVLLAMVAVLMFFADFMEQKFGKVTGTIALCVVAAAIAVFLYKDEIKKFFKRK